MQYILIITGLVLVALGTALAIAHSLRKQRDAAMQELATISRRLTDIDRKLEQVQGASEKEQELYRWPDFNRSAVMQHFSLSAARVGAAFAQGGGQSLPEFVRNCCLDHACRLMVEHPTMSFVEVGEASGYQRATTFYHDFKARFGMAPAEYRKLRVKN